jgi:hypothetical protein
MGPKFWNMKERTKIIANWYPNASTQNGQILGKPKKDISYSKIMEIWFPLKTSKLKA